MRRSGRRLAILSCKQRELTIHGGLNWPERNCIRYNAAPIRHDPRRVDVPEAAFEILDLGNRSASRSRESEMSVRYVLFDAVGTLLHVRPSVAEIYFRVGRKHGSRLTVDTIRQRFSDIFVRHQSLGPTDESRERDRWRAIVAEVFAESPDGIQAMFEELWEAFARTEHWALYDDVAATWRRLEERGFQLGIASNFDQRLISLCERLPPLDTTDRIYVSSRIGFPKPHPQFFRSIEIDLRARPEEILIVGDSRPFDYEGARSAGWSAVHLDRAALTSNSTTIRSLTELVNVLEGSVK